MPAAPASPLFLREAEIRRGLELVHFAQAQLYRGMDDLLGPRGLGRAHQRVLYFTARQPGLSVSALLRLLGITKQSLGRVLTDLTTGGFVETRTGTSDRRQRLLHLTPAGAALEAELFALLRARLSRAYSDAGPGAVAGFWAVLESLIPAADRPRIAGLGAGK
ncbi:MULTISPECIES: MarR family winged helix-turn-helix transcriptional regulator [Sphingomonas]|uniref:DNA-binding MarR family transcriptional regulator n=2 Tax=Sphingomonas TaxID=13687 RepID=A0A7W9BQD8_9SPHN|nr:MarR family transcriptional regulator [Sphingomonas prati]MBB5728049.1 DNA-binding MarR family transcriptional regulator [Sphingomonas prati]GGE82859.1 MarR family transcriptional regulator [Sphingomonas prati]